MEIVNLFQIAEYDDLFSLQVVGHNARVGHEFFVVSLNVNALNSLSFNDLIKL